MENFKFETLQLHAGHEPDSSSKSRAVPIYQTTSYVFDDTKHAKRLFDLEEPGNIYTRIMNPTTDVLEKRMAALEGGTGALAVASGSAAITYSIMNIAGAGDEIVAGRNLYGGTYNLFSKTLPKYGINTKFVDTDNFDEIKKAINEKTKGVFIETIGNPTGNIPDIEKIAEIAHNAGVPLLIDNTFATPFLCRPIEYGADIVIHSATKYLGGHGTTIAGVIVDSGKFNWANGKFPEFTTPDPSYHGIKYADLEGVAFIIKARVQLLRDTGAAISPFNSFLILQGIETLSLRMERHVENGKKVAEFLANHPKVATVNHPDVAGNKYSDLAKRYLEKGVSAIFTFNLKGGREAGETFINELKLFSHLANVADAKSLVIHPASTTHGQLSDVELKDAGIDPGMVRLSVGLENIDDIIGDLDQALGKVE